VLTDFENSTLLIASFLCIASVPFFCSQKNQLRKWILYATIGIAYNLFAGLLFPSIVANTSGNSILFVPVFLILIAAYILIGKSSPFQTIATLTIAAFLCFVQLSSAHHLLHHLAISLLFFGLAVRQQDIWFFLKDSSEKIANSWQEWVFGNVRIINHGFYIGFGAFLGIFMAGMLSGKEYAWAILIFAIIVIIFSALWAQIVEGSEKLKRPFGYYGALVGIPFGSLAVWAMGVDVWIIIAVVSVVMPWVQAIGRMRCLVNGCCHGSPVSNPHIGIRYFHYRSRVCNISGMKGKLLHPTQLYSMLWLFLIEFILLALWINHASASFIFGLYLILTGIGRFVEEAYRGEVQTKVLKGLRLYQWTALASVVIGIVMTTIPTAPIFTAIAFSWQIFLSAFIGGLFAMFAMGIDFPNSNRRFSRLV
jgi:prolipoprotein diacylglyceryltransferase